MKHIKTFWEIESYNIDPIECPYCCEVLDCSNIDIDKDYFGNTQIDKHKVKCHYCEKEFLITIDKT